MHREFRQLTRQIISAREEAQKKLSRGPHDEAVQTLVRINVELPAPLTGRLSRPAQPEGENRLHAAANSTCDWVVSICSPPVRVAQYEVILLVKHVVGVSIRAPLATLPPLATSRDGFAFPLRIGFRC